MHSDSRRRLQNLSPSLFPFPTIMATLEEQVALLMQQIQALQNQLSTPCHHLYICLQASEFPDKTSQMLFILSYMKGGATGTWAMHKIQQVLNPSGMPMMMDKFEAEVDLVFADLN